MLRRVTDAPSVPLPRAAAAPRGRAAAQRRGQERPGPAAAQRHDLHRLPRSAPPREGKGCGAARRALTAGPGRRGGPCTAPSRPSSSSSPPQQATAGSRVTGKFSLMPTNSHEATDKRVAKAGAAKRKEPSQPREEGRPRRGAGDGRPCRATDAGLGCFRFGFFIFVRRKRKKKNPLLCSFNKDRRRWGHASDSLQVQERLLRWQALGSFS